ncbi:MAG: hypothetical protein M1399_06165 [Actinobacteria bacterium]|nr:hypothetical protein [Actinomycetota bacterium]
MRSLTYCAPPPADRYSTFRDIKAELGWTRNTPVWYPLLVIGMLAPVSQIAV